MYDNPKSKDEGASFEVVLKRRMRRREAKQKLRGKKIEQKKMKIYQDRRMEEDK